MKFLPKIRRGGGSGGSNEGRGSRGRGIKVLGGLGNDKIDYGGVPELQMSKIREK